LMLYKAYTGCAAVREVLAIITPVSGIGHFSKQNLYLFIFETMSD